LSTTLNLFGWKNLYTCSQLQIIVFKYMSTTFSALITNYNTWELTSACIIELERWSKNNLTKILIVDDASNEKILDENLSDQVGVVYNAQNRGYAASVNIGFSHMNEDIVILLDSDAYPLMDLTHSLKHLFSNNPQLGAVGFKLVDRNGQPTGNADLEPNVLHLLFGPRFAELYYSILRPTTKPVTCIHSCGIAVRRIAFESVAGFDEGFDFLDADVDFSMRLQAAGWQIQIEDTLVVYHEGNGSPQTTTKRVLRHHRNRWRLLSKHGRIRVPILLKTVLFTRHIFEYVFLNTVGKLVIKDPEVLKDKVFGRIQLINQVWNNYENK
jgi:GT2 family glycosyltransferase